MLIDNMISRGDKVHFLRKCFQPVQSTWSTILIIMKVILGVCPKVKILSLCHHPHAQSIKAKHKNLLPNICYGCSSGGRLGHPLI